MGTPSPRSCRAPPPYPPLRKGGKRAQRNRDESAACTRPTFHQPRARLPPSVNRRRLAPCHDQHPTEERPIKTLITIILLTTSEAKSTEVRSLADVEGPFPIAARPCLDMGHLDNPLGLWAMPGIVVPCRDQRAASPQHPSDLLRRPCLPGHQRVWRPAAACA